jgi:phosphoserine phosphatase
MVDLLTCCRSAHGDALFDMDGTLFDGDLGETTFLLCLVGELLERDPLLLDSAQIASASFDSAIPAYAQIQSYQDALENGLFQQAYRMTASYMARYSDEQIFQFCKHAFSHFQEPTPLPGFSLVLHTRSSVDLLLLLRACQRNLVPVYLVSASPLSVVRSFCRLFDLDQVICLGADHDDPVLPYGEGKVQALARMQVKKACLGFGNSTSDAPMLGLCEHVFFRNPGEDGTLHDLCEKNGWTELF